MKKTAPRRPSKWRRMAALSGMGLFVFVSVFWMLGIFSWRSQLGSSRDVSERSEGGRSSGLLLKGNLKGGNSSNSPASVSGAASGAVEGDQDASAALREWLRRYSQASEDDRLAMLADGLAIAEARREIMLERIRKNPERALRESLRWDEVQGLPALIRQRVETPFSEVVDYKAFPSCGSRQNNDEIRDSLRMAEMHFSDGTRVDAFVYGRRMQVGSKQGLPVQGIRIAGLAAVRESVFQTVQAAESDVIRSTFPSGQPDMSRSFYSGQPIAGKPLEVLAGGQRYVFASEEEVHRLDLVLAKLDAKPGPKAGSRLLCALPARAADPISGSFGAFDVAQAQAMAMQASAEWTLTKKKVFLIRADFEDQPGESVSQAAASGVMNGAANDAIQAMSYGKTSVSAQVSAKVYRLPRKSSYYSDKANAGYAGSDFTSKNTDLLEDARKVFRSSKSGADALINIGVQPASSSVGDETQDLGDYDVVGVTFGKIGCKGSGFSYAGLASVGAGDLWLQGNNEASVYTHEIGHVYGLEHSNFWDTNGASVVGTGSEKEYGDVYDVMGDGDLPNAHFHPQAKDRLSWLDSSQWIDVKSSGEYTIYRFDDPTTQGVIRGLRLTKVAGKAPNQDDAEYYWVGYRAAYSENPHMSQGAYLLWQRAGLTRCCLVDTTPGSSSGKLDAGIDIGRTYTDPSGAVSITPLAAGGSGSEQWLRLRVNLGPVSGNVAPTVAAAITGDANAVARADAPFSITATDSNQDILTYFWDAGDGTVASGNGVNASSFVHRWAAGGTYTLSVTVSDMNGKSVTRTKPVLVSDPALTYTKVPSGVSSDLNAVAVSPNQVVAVGENGAILTSPDGLAWTVRSVAESTLNLKFSAVIWDGVQFIAVGSDAPGGGDWLGVIYTSDSGIVWTRRYLSTTADSGLNAVASGGGVLIAVGNSGIVLSSGDGVAWAPVSVPDVDALQTVTGVAYGGGVFVLTSLDTVKTAGGWSNPGGGRISTSANGKAWVTRTSGSSVENLPALRSLAYVNDRFVGSSWYSGLRVSTDGGQTFKTSRTSSEELSVFAGGTGLYLASGASWEASGDQNAKVAINLLSMDGQEWSKVSAPVGAAGVSGIALFNSQLLSVGSAGAIYRSGVISPGLTGNHAPQISQLLGSLEVSARTSSVYAADAADVDGDSLTYQWEGGNNSVSKNGKSCVCQWLAGGTYSLRLTVNDGRGGSVTRTEKVVVKDPATSFTKVDAVTAPQQFNGIASNGTLAVAVGSSGVLRSSLDGVTWKQITAGRVQSNLYFEAVIWDGSRFIAVGRDANAAITALVAAIYISSDGVTWTQKYVAASSSSVLRAVAVGGGVIVAGGDNGLVVRSTDGGLNWAQVSVFVGTPAQSVQGIAFGAGKFVMTSVDFTVTGTRIEYPGDGKIARSSNGLSWEIEDAVAGSDSLPALQKIAYLNDRFVGSNWASKLRVSTDIGASFRTSRGPVEQLNALVFGDGLYFGAGVENSDAQGVDSDRDVLLLSADGESWTQVSAPSGLTGVTAGAYHQGRILMANKGSIWRSDVLSSAATQLQIVTQPDGRSAKRGETISLSVLASGQGNLTYQWQKNGVNWSGKTQSTLSFTMDDASLAGDYTVVVSDVSGSTLTSQVAKVQWASEGVKPTIVTVSAAPTKAVLGGTLTLSASSDGTVPLSFQWLRNGSSIVGGTSQSLRITPVTLASEGAYQVVVSNSFGSGSSAVLPVEVLMPPVIQTQPKGGVYKTGDPFLLSAEAFVTSGSLKYQWRKNQNDIVGATQSSYAVSGIKASDAGFYSVRISSDGGDITSDSVEVKVGSPTIVAGVYQGLLHDESSERLSGRLTLAVTSTGALSGNLIYDGRWISLAGTFNSSFAFNQSVPVTSSGTLGLSISVDSGSLSLSVCVNESYANRESATRVSSGSAERMPFKVSTYKASQAGRYTVLLTQNSSAVGGDLDLGVGPVGYAFGRVFLGGSAMVVGRLSDGLSFSAQAFVSVQGTSPVYTRMYFASTGPGWIGGPLTWDPTGAAQGDLEWKKPESEARLYSEGLLVGMNAKVVPYVMPASGGSAVDLVEGRWQLRLERASAATVLGPVYLRGSSVVLGVIQPPVFQALRLGVADSTGEVKGSVRVPDVSRVRGSKTFNLRGVILQGEGAASGFFEEAGQKGSFWLEAP